MSAAFPPRVRVCDFSKQIHVRVRVRVRSVKKLHVRVRVRDLKKFHVHVGVRDLKNFYVRVRVRVRDLDFFRCPRPCRRTRVSMSTDL